MEVLTETIYFTVEDACQEGLYIRWQNDYGGIDQYYFHGNVSHLPSQGGVEYFSPYIDDLVDEVGNFEVIKKEYAEGMKCFAYFDKENAEAFKQLMRSKEVHWYNIDTWIKVDVIVDSFVVEAFGGRGKIAIKVIFPTKYTK